MFSLCSVGADIIRPPSIGLPFVGRGAPAPPPKSTPLSLWGATTQRAASLHTVPVGADTIRPLSAAGQTKNSSTRLGEAGKGFPREPSAAGRVGKGSTAERVRNGACAIAKDAEPVVTPRLEPASRHPTNGLRPFVGTLPDL